MNRCLVAPNKLRPFRLTAEVFSVETNEKVNETYSSMQTPKVENKTIVIDDYSTQGRRISKSPARWRPSHFLTVPLCVAALTMQILKPAGFVDTAHYPLLLLV